MFLFVKQHIPQMVLNLNGFLKWLGGTFSDSYNSWFLFEEFWALWPESWRTLGWKMPFVPLAYWSEKTFSWWEIISAKCSPLEDASQLIPEQLKTALKCLDLSLRKFFFILFIWICFALFLRKFSFTLFCFSLSPRKLFFILFIWIWVWAVGRRPPSPCQRLPSVGFRSC